jgi:hypothetical protein
VLLPTCKHRKLNHIHIAGIFKKLASTSRPSRPDLNPAAETSAAADTAGAGPAEACDQLLNQLQQLTKQQRCAGHGPRGIANILTAVAKLQPVLDVELLHMLLDSFCTQIAVATPQDIASVMWSVAQVTLAHFGSLHVHASSINAAVNQKALHAEAATAAEGQISSNAEPEPVCAAADFQAAAEGVEGRPVQCFCKQAGLKRAAAAEKDVLRQDTPDQQQQPEQQKQQEHQEQQQTADVTSNIDQCSSVLPACVAQVLLDNTARHMQQQRRLLQNQQWQPPLRPQQQLLSTPLISQKQVQLLLLQLSASLAGAHSQIISNVTWAAAVLQHSHCWCMCLSLPSLQRIVEHFASLPDVMPRHVQNVLHCMVQVKTVQQLQPHTKESLLAHPCPQSTEAVHC